MDIISEIVQAVNGGDATKTKIMQKAFLSLTQIKEYARVLTQNNLLNYDTYTQTFKTTEKGLIFEIYNQMDDRMKQLKNTKKSRVEGI